MRETVLFCVFLYVPNNIEGGISFLELLFNIQLLLGAAASSHSSLLATFVNMHTYTRTLLLFLN